MAVNLLHGAVKSPEGFSVQFLRDLQNMAFIQGTLMS